jgi:hypothetical protein
MECNINIDLFKGLKKIVSKGNLLDYEYLREFAAKIGTPRNVVYGIYAEPNFCKNPRKSA